MRATLRPPVGHFVKANCFRLRSTPTYFSRLAPPTAVMGAPRLRFRIFGVELPFTKALAPDSVRLCSERGRGKLPSPWLRQTSLFTATQPQLEKRTTPARGLRLPTCSRRLSFPTVSKPQGSFLPETLGLFRATCGAKSGWPRTRRRSNLQRWRQTAACWP